MKPGLLPSVPGWQLAGLQRSREMADYDSATEFSGNEVRSLLALVANLASDAMAVLGREGLLA